VVQQETGQRSLTSTNSVKLCPPDTQVTCACAVTGHSAQSGRAARPHTDSRRRQRDGSGRQTAAGRRTLSFICRAFSPCIELASLVTCVMLGGMDVPDAGAICMRMYCEQASALVSSDGEPGIRTVRGRSACTLSPSALLPAC
jgi:hypothetical protein